MALHELQADDPRIKTLADQLAYVAADMTMGNTLLITLAARHLFTVSAMVVIDLGGAMGAAHNRAQMVRMIEETLDCIRNYAPQDAAQAVLTKLEGLPES